MNTTEQKMASLHPEGVSMYHSFRPLILDSLCLPTTVFSMTYPALWLYRLVWAVSVQMKLVVMYPMTVPYSQARQAGRAPYDLVRPSCSTEPIRPG